VGLNIAFLMVVVLPCLVLLVGNIYCGYLCPFGALQELVGSLRPRRLVTHPEKGLWRYARGVKYVLLFLVVAVFALTLDTALASSDPLVTVFSGELRAGLLTLVVLILVLSFVYDRFWCRNLCPAGAFLSILNGVQAVKRLAPVGNYKMCMYGVRSLRDLDCICCDRCRHLKQEESTRIKAALALPSTRRRGLVFLIAVGLLAVFFVRETVTTWHVQRLAALTGRTAAGAAGRPRDVDMAKLEALIRDRHLSEREAMFYKPVEAPAPRPAGGEAPAKQGAF
jgi:hypothetical protein